MKVIDWFWCWSETTLYTAYHNYLFCSVHAESVWLMHHQRFGGDHSEGSPAWINRGKGLPHYWFRPAQQLSPWAPIFLNSSVFGRKLSSPRGERLCRGFMELCITLRRSIMTASQVLSSQDPANPLLAAANFFLALLCFACWNKGHLQGNMH